MLASDVAVGEWPYDGSEGNIAIFLNSHVSTPDEVTHQTITSVKCSAFLFGWYHIVGVEANGCASV